MLTNVMACPTVKAARVVSAAGTPICAACNSVKSDDMIYQQNAGATEQDGAQHALHIERMQCMYHLAYPDRDGPSVVKGARMRVLHRVHM